MTEFIWGIDDLFPLPTYIFNVSCCIVLTTKYWSQEASVVHQFVVHTVFRLCECLDTSDRLPKN